MLEVIAIQPHLWILPLVAGVLILLGALWFFGFEDWFGYGNGGWAITGVAFWILALAPTIIWIISLIPFDSKYHVLYKLEGKVESVSNTFEGGSGKMTSKPVIQLSGYDEPIQMDNPRIVTLEGHEVTLTCYYSWEMYGLDITKCDLSGIK